MIKTKAERRHGTERRLKLAHFSCFSEGERKRLLRKLKLTWGRSFVPVLMRGTYDGNQCFCDVTGVQNQHGV